MSTGNDRQILALLAKEWNFNGPPGIMDISDVVAAMPLAPSETLSALKGLYTEGLVDMNALKTSVYLTPEGYEAAGTDRGTYGRPP